MERRFSVIIPFYNEAEFLPDTLESWLRQERRPDEFVLIDNGSTDGSMDVCRSCLQSFSGTVVYEADSRPGKVNALETGYKRATGTYVALSDADTMYPPHYLALVEELIAAHGEDVVAFMAQGTGDSPDAPMARLRRKFYALLSQLLSKQTFTGGYGQVLRADVLERAGGFSEELWPYVLLDHEVMHRIHKLGRSLYHVDLWCRPSGRRADRSAVRWTLFERLLYHVTPFVLKDRFFYDFLGPRFAARGMTHLRLRQKPWESRHGRSTTA